MLKVIKRLYTVFFFLMVIVFSGWGTEERELELLPRDMNVTADQYEKLIVQMNLEIVDTPLVRYIDSIIYNLQGASRSNRTHRIKFIRSQEPNAYSLANGSIHICVGLFSTIMNEAQLALLLSHEMAHVLSGHHMKRQYELHVRSRKAVQSQLAAFIILGVGLGSTARMVQRAMSGFSRNLEYEADSLAIVWAQKAGYNVSEGIKLFENLKVRFDMDSIKLDTSYTTHPLLEKRLEYSSRIVSNMGIDTTSGYSGKIPYNDLIIPSLITTCKIQKKSVKNDQVIATCNLLDTLSVDSIDHSRIKAQAFLAKGGKENLDSAYMIFTRILKNDQTDPEIYRDMGYVFMKQKVKDSATFYLNRYLDIDPYVTDSGFVRYYLRKLFYEESR
jgi:Zn-dependent protease with chaperone function